MKKILLVSHEMTYTGAPRSLLNIAKILLRLNYEVSVYTLEDGNFKREYEKIGLSVQRVPEKKQWLQLLKEYDVAIFNTIFTLSLCIESQNIIRSILYIREAENIPDIGIGSGIPVENIKNIKEAICLSEYAKAFIMAKYRPKKLTVIHNFVNDEYHGELNLIKNNTINFMISGTVEWRKGHDNVINAYLCMPEELRRISQLHIVGRMPEWSKPFWKHLIPKDEPSIIYHGEISDEKERISLYKRMNVFIVASRDEACSLVALEGAMLGKALILSENTGAKYLDVDGKYIYTTEDIGALSRKMCQLTSRKELIIRGGKMRRQYLKTSTSKKYEAQIKKIIDGEEK